MKDITKEDASILFTDEEADIAITNYQDLMDILTVNWHEISTFIMETAEDNDNVWEAWGSINNIVGGNVK